MNDLWRPLGIVAALAALLVFLLMRSASPDLGLRKSVQEGVELVELRDAELTRDALLARAGLLPNYDALLRDRAQLQAALAGVEQASRSGTPASSEVLQPSIAALSRALDEKLADVEHFKTDDALLRNSIAYLTYTLTRLDRQPNLSPPVAMALDELSNAFLRFIQKPNASGSAELKSALERLPVRGDDDETRTLVVHGTLVAESLPRVVSLLRGIVAAPTAVRVGDVQARLETVAGEAEARAQGFRYALFAASLLLLAYLAMQFMRLRTQAGHLRRTNDDLSREIAEREQAQNALRASEERFRAIAESAHDAIISTDSDGVVVSWNPGAQAIFGCSADEIVGQPLTRLLLQRDDAARNTDARLAAASQSGRTLEATGVRKDGSRFPLEASVARWSTAQGSFITAIIRDVSARKALEATAQQQERKLVQANKMAALGTLVSGVAHEINNPNQMVLLNSSVLADAWRDACPHLDAQRELDGDFTLAGLPYSEMREGAATLIRDLNEGARRIDRIVQDLKDFARPQRHGPQVDVDVNDTAQRTARLLAHLVQKKTKRFGLALAPRLPPVRGDAQQVEQVLVNLIVNALEALPDPSKGVHVTTERRATDGWVVVEVRDEGIGIPAEHLQRLCDPFFTTKQDSGGTGLGLSVTFSLVQAHGGRLDFASEPGRGTRVTVSFPPAPVDAPAAAAPA